MMTKTPDAYYTEPLYWTDQLLREFTAKVVEIKSNELVLDKTAFYPAGGGQVCDLGVIHKKGNEKIKVKIKTIEKRGQKIIHIIEGKNHKEILKGDLVVGKIDWERRAILMRAHTSQHIISAFVEKITSIKTAKANIDVDEVAIYLEKKISNKQLTQVIIETNKFLFSNKKIKTMIYNKDDIPEEIKQQLRGDLEDKEQNQVRVVSIEGLDHSLCGGSHVKSTEKIGTVFLTDFRGDIINYVHGKSALEKMTAINIDTISAAKILSSKPQEVKKRIEIIVEELEELRDINSILNKIALEYQLDELRNHPLLIDKYKIVSGDFHYAKRKFVLQQLGTLPKDTIFALIVKGPILLLLSEIAELTAKELIEEYCRIAKIKGGGSEKIAQAAVTTPEKALITILEIIKRKLQENSQ